MYNSWKNSNLKNRFLDKTSLFFIFFILFYGIQGIISIFNNKVAPPLDIFAAASIITLFFILHLFIRFKIIVPIFIGIGFIPHIFGLYPLFGEGISLYGLSSLDYHYDWIVHSFGIFCYSIAFCSIIYPYLKKGLKSKFLIFILVLFFMLGLGAFNEILEYVGFDVFGYGKGFLEFGDGDSSPYAGPWQNSSMDMVSNLVGGVIGTGSFLLLKKRNENNQID
ncbi:hypothetical protein KY342_04055 [Candidatus Woesearchaeota archaeon]|nr:hypothetical protein [Candidatus Woesearchaeota archaeon]